MSRKKEINENELLELLNLEDPTVTQEDVNEALESLDLSENSSEDIIRSNISKANFFLDKIMGLVQKGGLSPRFAEVASQLINAVTTATNSLMSAELDISSLQLKSEMLELKKKELEIKQAGIGVPRSLQQNVIVTDREGLLKIINQRGADNDGQHRLPGTDSTKEG